MGPDFAPETEMKITIELSQEAYDWLKNVYAPEIPPEQAAARLIEWEFDGWKNNPPPGFFDDNNKIPF
jgi:hypothetical protein